MINFFRKAETKYLDLQHNLNEIQLSRSACRKQLHKAMNFAKDLVAEQEALLKALNQRHMENKAVKMLGSDIANRMDSLKMQLKVRTILIFFGYLHTIALDSPTGCLARTGNCRRAVTETGLFNYRYETRTFGRSRKVERNHSRKRKE